MTDLVEAPGVPMALHGGSGLSAALQDLIVRGCAKVNISTALKEYMRSALASLQEAEASDGWDPPRLFADQRDAVVATAREHIALVGWTGRAW